MFTRGGGLLTGPAGGQSPKPAKRTACAEAHHIMCHPLDIQSSMTQ